MMGYTSLSLIDWLLNDGEIFGFFFFQSYTYLYRLSTKDEFKTKCGRMAPKLLVKLFTVWPVRVSIILIWKWVSGIV